MRANCKYAKQCVFYKPLLWDEENEVYICKEELANLTCARKVFADEIGMDRVPNIIQPKEIGFVRKAIKILTKPIEIPKLKESGGNNV